MTMETFAAHLERLKLSDDISLQLSHVINLLRENTCLKQKCIKTLDGKEKENISILLQCLPLISIKSLIENIDKLIEKSCKTFHFSCVVEMIHILYEGIVKKMNSDEKENKISDAMLEDLILLSKKCLEQPDILSPVPVDAECESMEIFNKITQENIAVTSTSLQFYLDILFTYIKPDGQIDINKDESRINILEEPSSNQKLIVKRTASKALILACCRLGEQPWTCSDLTKICYDVLCCIKLCSKHDSYSSLLTGKDCENKTVLFKNGLLGNILNDLMPFCHKDRWKKNAPPIHAFLWCFKKVTFPDLGQHLPKLVPPLLLLADDYITEHKLLGILSLTHLIENVNPADLRLYNHADVIYDLLILLLFSNQYNIYDATIICLLKLLPTFNIKSNVVDGIKFTRWDTSFVKLMDNVDMTSNINAELVLLKHIPEFIDQMGGNAIKHVDKIINLVSLPIPGDGKDVTKKRLSFLKILATCIKVCWPVIPIYQKKIFKIILRILIDSCMASSVGHNLGKEKVEDDVYNVLVLMKLSCGVEAEETLSSVLNINFHTHLEPVHRIVKKVMEMHDYVK